MNNFNEVCKSGNHLVDDLDLDEKHGKQKRKREYEDETVDLMEDEGE